MTHLAPPLSENSSEDPPASISVEPLLSLSKEPSLAILDTETEEERGRLTEAIVQALKTVYDPEIPVDIYELGLIYKVEIEEGNFIHITMTLTAPGCPVAGEMPLWVENAVSALPNVSGVEVSMVFDPPWDQSRMSEEARIALDMW